MRARVRPGGRSERVREVVARTCLELLAEGELELTPATVAARSGVSRKTLYRWWPTRTALLREALALHTRRLEPPDTGSWAGDLRALVDQLAAFFSDPIERAQNAILMSGRYPEFSRVMRDYYAPIQAGWRALVERGVEHGEVAPDVDPDLVVSLVISPLLVTSLIGRRKPTARERGELARLVLRATQKPVRGGGRPVERAARQARGAARIRRSGSAPRRAPR